MTLLFPHVGLQPLDVGRQHVLACFVTSLLSLPHFNCLYHDIVRIYKSCHLFIVYFKSIYSDCHLTLAFGARAPGSLFHRQSHVQNFSESLVFYPYQHTSLWHIYHNVRRLNDTPDSPKIIAG